VRALFRKLRGLFTLKRTTLLFAFGFLFGIVVLLGAHVGLEKTNSNQFCNEVCHAHPDATRTWISSTHFSTKSGVVTNCIDCHLPGNRAPEFYIEKARLGLHDLYGQLFKDVEKIDWAAKRNLDHAKTITFESSCLRCHQNLFSKGLSQKGVDAHLHYQRTKGETRCINCHLHVGHLRPVPQVVEDEEEKFRAEDEKLFPVQVEGLQNFSQPIPGSDVRMQFVAIPGGTFQMGSPENEPYRREDEGPVRTVKVSPFWMGRFEVSWREYEVYIAQRGTRGRAGQRPGDEAATGPTPPYGSPDQGWGRGSRPAITMTHHAAMQFTEWLSSITGKKFRLPTEAEWEYACRAGTTGPYFFEGSPTVFTRLSLRSRIFGPKTSPIEDYAWYVENSGARSHPPRSTQPNPFGLYNMIGNVRELVLDWYDPEAYEKSGGGVELVNPRGPESGTERVVRGGSFKSDAVDLRCAARDHTQHDRWLMTDPQSPKSIWWYSDVTDVGFRVVLEYEGENAAPPTRTAAVGQRPAR
jgi:formylglycine-generating enzyme required for sulfatase activity